MKPGSTCNVGLDFIIPSIYGYKRRPINTEAIPLKYENKLDTKYGYFLQRGPPNGCANVT